MALTDIVEKFGAAGGSFVTPVGEMSKKLAQCRGIVFDWDGVFNDGRKGMAIPSGFTEADSMGVNMLRYGLWRKFGTLPYTAIISGVENETAVAFAKREHLSAVYTGVRKKQDVISHLCKGNGLDAGDIACVYDDINDLAMAEVCGLRFLVRRDASPLFTELTIHRSSCDYVTGAGSGGHAVREVCELLLGIMGSYAEVVESRVLSDAEYEQYFKSRQAIRTSCYFVRDGVIGKA